MRHSWELIPREKGGRGGEGSTAGTHYTAHKSKSEARLAIKMPIRVLIDVNAAP